MMTVDETTMVGNEMEVSAEQVTEEPAPVTEAVEEADTDKMPEEDAEKPVKKSVRRKKESAEKKQEENDEAVVLAGDEIREQFNKQADAAMEEVQLAEISEINTDKYLTVPKVRVHTIERYKELMQDKVIFSQTFATIDKYNVMYAFVGDGIRLKMPSKGIDGFYHNRRDVSKEELLSKTYNVMVTDVIEDEKLVYVSANAAKEKPRKKMRKLLDEGIESKVYKVVNAKVIGISSSKNPESRKPKEVCLLNIGGLGIMGSMVLADWSTCFTSSFNSVVSVGDIVKVAVVDKKHWSSMEDDVYLCSRKLTLNPNPWEGIQKALKVGDMVRVKCVDRTDRNFFGKIEGFEELNAYCFYPKDPDYVIETGKTYVGRVARVNEKTRDLKVRL